jgi:hypothetical protein
VSGPTGSLQEGMPDLLELRETIAERIDAGASLDQVEVDLIESQGHLDDEEKAALWLFAWSLEPLAGWRLGSNPT